MTKFYQTLLVLYLCFLSGLLVAQDAIFLHHSTGGNVFYEGGVEAWITSYNTTNNTNYSITETSYPTDPWPWANYAYDFWKLWVDGSCNNTNPNIACLDYYTQNYDLIIFKHCFPGAAIGPDEENPSVSSENKTIANYKLQYRALRDKFDAMPATKFMVWTLAPLHRNATNSDDALRALQFVQWVKTDWLTEDGKAHPNIFVFDFFGQVAELDPNALQGKPYCLKYAYEASHDGDDSHPNTVANQSIGPLFAESVVRVLSVQTTSVSNHQNAVSVFPSLLNQGQFLTIKGHQNSHIMVEIYNLNGQNVWQQMVSGNNGQISTQTLKPGMYLVKAGFGNQQITQKFVVQ